MVELPYRMEHVPDAIADTSHMTNEEVGAYQRLKWALWLAGGYLPEAQLRNHARGGKRWSRIVGVISEKLTFARGVFSIARELEMRLLARERRAKAAEKGAAAAKARWRAPRSEAPNRDSYGVARNAEKSHKNNEGSMLEALIMQSMSNANQNQTLKNPSSLSKRDARKVAGNQEESAAYRLGEALLVERVGVRGLAARSQVSKWITKVGDELAVAAILEAIERENIRGPHLVRIVDQRTSVLENERKRGPALPLHSKPQIVRGSG